MYYPLMIELSNRQVCIIGGGKVAFRKVKKFLEYQAKVRVISTEFIEEFYNLEKRFKGKIILIKENFCEELIKDEFIVVGATNNKEVNRSIGEYCKEKHLLCNIVDSKELSSFIVPSTIKRGELIMSVSTLGNSPSFCSKIRKELEERYTKELEELVYLLGDARKLVLKNVEDEKEKKHILNSMADMDITELKQYISKLTNKEKK
ncbi:bifunctional precorrin-2 dehydrogenase/sirohydrochlorin ferrochelatase [Hathewaya limosa]|uniref:precorrin-2 dehydrogenase n=2 Tax=Hathewaya limosa TaxID=1536 RepID=A0ABU0JV51_HATLI|nr:precorrin-2 dehydrogenase/sirohydrochlorin ferrochelatase [Hathewaya limosa]